MPLTNHKRSPLGGSGFIHWGERILWFAALSALGYCLYVTAHSWQEQVRARRELEEILQNKRVPKAGSLVGRIEIPRLKLDAMIFEGTGQPTLANGVGHLRQSPLPGARGNVVLAGHRDTFFRSLGKVRSGDEILVTTPEGVFHYMVNSTEVIRPEEVEVLGPRRGVDLTLITCYPFTFIGDAPLRYVVKGRFNP